MSRDHPRIVAAASTRAPMNARPAVTTTATELARIDAALITITSRYERSLDQGSFDLADILYHDIDKLLDARWTLTHSTV